MMQDNLLVVGWVMSVVYLGLSVMCSLCEEVSWLCKSNWHTHKNKLHANMKAYYEHE